MISVTIRHTHKTHAWNTRINSRALVMHGLRATDPLPILSPPLLPPLLPLANPFPFPLYLSQTPSYPFAPTPSPHCGISCPYLYKVLIANTMATTYRQKRTGFVIREQTYNSTFYKCAHLALTYVGPVPWLIWRLGVWCTKFCDSL